MQVRDKIEGQALCQLLSCAKADVALKLAAVKQILRLRLQKNMLGPSGSTDTREAKRRGAQGN